MAEKIARMMIVLVMMMIIHLSGNLASLRNIVLTSLTVEVELIHKTLKGLSENKEHGERGVGGEGGEGGGGGD